MHIISKYSLSFFKTLLTISILFYVFNSNLYANEKQIATKKIAYIVSDIKIPFWQTIYKGIKSKAAEKGHEVVVYSANNLKKEEIKNMVRAISEEIDGIILSPINSSTAVTALRFANNANIPVVISDIGTDRGEYLSFISSNNYDGAYQIGKILSSKMTELNLHTDGTVGIIAIPQQRSNGKERTKGFISALDQSGIKVTGLFQQATFEYQETYDYTLKLINENPNLKAIWLQTSNCYQAAIDAIEISQKTNEILLVSFDAEPEFLELIPKGIILSAAMQQPFYMGEQSVEALDKFFLGKIVQKENQLEILAISTDNIKEKLPLIKRNVLGIIEKEKINE